MWLLDLWGLLYLMKKVVQKAYDPNMSFSCFSFFYPSFLKQEIAKTGIHAVFEIPPKINLTRKTV